MSLINSFIARTLPIVPRPLVGRFSRPYIAGELLDDAMRVVRELNQSGCLATLDVLGEFVTDLRQAEHTVQMYIDTLDRIAQERVESHVSIKLTSLGLLQDVEACAQNLRRIVDHARDHANFVRIDMEDSSCTDATLDLYERMRAEYDQVGAVLQSYMRRTQADARAIAKSPGNVRVCKGIYVEPRSIAFKDRDIVRRNFVETVRILLGAGTYVGIATHDEHVVWACEQVINDLGLPPDRYEFQMLLGVDEQLRKLIVASGHQMRIYVPFGPKWYAYSLRRLKENPAIAGHVLRATLGFGPSRNGSG